jgi:hypothetical protein
MRGKVAKRIRKAIFGTDLSPRARKYRQHPRIPGTCIADEKRQGYQALKRAYRQGKFVL